MEGNETTKEVKLKEFDEINAILPTLWNDGLLTDFECRTIASAKNLVTKKAEVYNVVMSKTKEEAAILTELFRKGTEATHVKVNATRLNNSKSNDDENYSILPSKNPFMNNTIIKHLFGYLPLQDMKGFRLVCRQWNSTAEICLRKRSAIHFRPNVLLPHTFMEVFKYSHPDLPFSSFKFSNEKNLSWDIDNFMDKYGKHIKEVSFHTVKLTGTKCNSTNRNVLISNYDVTPLFFHPSNITSLTIDPYYLHKPKTTLDISLEKFVSIKTLFLARCRVIVSAEYRRPDIAPVNIRFENVSFIQNGETLKNFCYNNLVNFSKALEIFLNQDTIDGIENSIFDMGQQVFNADDLLIVGRVILENWIQAKGEMGCLCVNSNPFVEKNHLNIRELKFTESKIDLTALPQTLEVLDLSNSNDLEIVCSEQARSQDHNLGGAQPSFIQKLNIGREKFEYKIHFCPYSAY